MHVYEWLRDNTSVRLVAPVAVKLGRETYHGASYFEPAPRTEAVLYLLGNVPAAYKRSRRVCWQFDGDERDWYLAAFADAAIAADLPEFHPFGAWFQLRQWPTVLPGGERAETIDAYQQAPYRRLRALDVSHLVTA